MDPKKAHYVVVTGIIIKDGKFLITKRNENEKAFPGLWTVPGGKLELDDYSNRKADTDAGQWYNICEDLLKREVKEETNLEFKNLKYLTSLSFIRPDNIPVFVISFYADYHTGDVKLSDEMTDHAWVTLEEAKSYKLIDGIFEELVMINKILKGQAVERWDKDLK